jgi:pimeloyl-ACP methyl ester carboxylesterase
VWLGAFVPDGKRALVDELQADPSAVFNEEWVGADPTRDPVLATYFLFHDCDLETLRWGLGTVRAFIPQLPYRRPAELAVEIPSTYVLCRQDRTIRAKWARREAHRRLGVEPVEIDAGHCPHVAQPARIAEILDTL